MRAAFRERPLPVLAAGCAAAAAPGLVIWAVGGRAVQVDGAVHFYAVGLTALAAAAAAIALMLIGARFDDTRTVIVGLSFGVMAALLALHGLATPGFFVGPNGVVTLTGGVTLPVGAALLALSVLPRPRPLAGVRPLLVLGGILLSAVLGLGLSGLLFPELLPRVPEPDSQPALALLAGGLALLVLLAARAVRTFLLTRRVSDLAVAVGIVWLATSLVVALTTTYLELGWWLGHALELDGILLVGIPVTLDLARTAQSRPLSGDLRPSELVNAEEYYLGSHVRALTVELAERDAYTEQHTRRVALRAVQVGELLGLSTARLRALAIGGLVHDIGKLAVREGILDKPGPLDDHEYAVVQHHPEWGVSLLDSIGHFPDGVRRLVRDHHERLDGKGYPRGVTADAIDLDTRILTVCDVYDALISDRSYRAAWSHDEAVALLRADSGTAFDPRCVEALEEVLWREGSTARERRRVPASRASADRAAQALPA